MTEFYSVSALTVIPGFFELVIIAIPLLVVVLVCFVVFFAISREGD